MTPNLFLLIWAHNLLFLMQSRAHEVCDLSLFEAGLCYRTFKCSKYSTEKLTLMT
jgi:hypothetical protein